MHQGSCSYSVNLQYCSPFKVRCANSWALLEQALTPVRAFTLLILYTGLTQILVVSELKQVFFHCICYQKAKPRKNNNKNNPNAHSSELLKLIFWNKVCFYIHSMKFCFIIFGWCLWKCTLKYTHRQRSERSYFWTMC